MVEAQFPLALAVASLCIARGRLPTPHDPTGFETTSATEPKSIAVIGVGHWRGEGMALLEAVD
jgi:3-oxoacyl-[acyl-carrier-protein] synthase II